MNVLGKGVLPFAVCVAAVAFLIGVSYSLGPDVASNRGLELQSVLADGSSPYAPSSPHFQELGQSASVLPIRVMGSVAAQEARIYRIRAGVDGRFLETGVAAGSLVRKGEKLGTFHSVSFIDPERAYLDALEHSASPARTGFLRIGRARTLPVVETAAQDLQRSLDTLRRLGMPDVQVEELKRTGELTEDIAIYSPIDGLVLSRNASSGQTFRRGAEWFAIADLSRVWVVTDMSESQASLVQAAASATVRTAGQTLHAEIGMLATALDPATRTLRLRLDLDNPDHELQPGTLVEVEFGGSLPGTFHASADSNTGLPLLAADRSATAQ